MAYTAMRNKKGPPEGGLSEGAYRLEEIRLR
jgi:hypothetical protein